MVMVKHFVCWIVCTRYKANMDRKSLSTEQANSLLAKIKSVWGWSGYYFYPLHPISRKDVLAFDGSLLEPILPEGCFQKFMEAQCPLNIRCWREVGESEELQFSSFEFGYGYSELVVVNGEFDWLIYWSHENTITFGGEGLIAQLKILLPNWSLALSKLS